MVEVALDHGKKGPLGPSPCWFREKKVSFGARNKFPCWFRKKKFSFGALLMSKLLELGWLDIGLVLYCVFIDLEFVSVHKNAKKNLANIQPS